jgi:hypothetical protein
LVALIEPLKTVAARAQWNRRAMETARKQLEAEKAEPIKTAKAQ